MIISFFHAGYNPFYTLFCCFSAFLKLETWERQSPRLSLELGNLHIVLSCKRFFEVKKLRKK